MKSKPTILNCLAIIVLVISGCIGSKFGSQKDEKLVMNPLPKNDVVYNALEKIRKQGHPQTMIERSRGSRGLIGSFEGGVLSFGVSAVKSVISDYKKKYNGSWEYGLNDLYFYDQPSLDGPFDPVGIQFTGFTLTRTITIDHDERTAVKAEFELNTDSLASMQMINDGVFRLKVKNIQVHYSKAKVPARQEFVNMDFEITFSTSYISKEGQFNTNVQLGKFIFTLRHAPLDSTKTGYKEYYDKLKDSSLAGKSFIVPRSYGYYKTLDTAKRAFTLTPYWNQGNFSISAKVTESSKNLFVEEMLINTSGIGIDYGNSAILNKLKKN